MVNVATLACSYTWASTLAYNQAYRQQQAQHHLQWGKEVC
jgi:hypothetical protein